MSLHVFTSRSLSVKRLELVAEKPERPDESQILATMPMPVLLLDNAARIAFANDASEHFFARSAKNLINNDVSDILKFDDSRMADLLHASERDIDAQDIEVVTSNGSVIADISIAKFMDSAGWRLLLISPRYGGRAHIGENEDVGQQQAMGAPAILSHEIKNPLAGIKGAAQLLAKRTGDDDRPLIDLIVTEVDRIAKLLDQMQNLGNAAPQDLAAFNIHEIIERTIRSIRAANATLPEFSINYDPSLPDVLIDDDAMVQILINLMQNAVDALVDVDDAMIEISTRFVMSGELIDTGNSRKSAKLPVEITITDNGTGVPEKIKGEVFAPFVTTKREGQGLGLAIVRKLVNQMHGRIVYERNDIVCKSHFRIFLPVATNGKA